MSDPSFKEEAPPTRPPRPTQQTRQLQDDEMYARQLAEHYNGQTAGQPTNPRSQGQGRRQPQGTDEDGKEYSFFDGRQPLPLSLLPASLTFWIR